jgi:GT2 family glycosyltransferase
MQISASLVLYKIGPDVFVPAIESFLAAAPDGLLVVIDQSPTPSDHALFRHPRVNYHFLNQNGGFGFGHNRALEYLGGRSDVHLILNPDIEFGTDVIEHLVQELKANPDISAMMPRIQYPDGSPQRLAKMLPTPVDLFIRRFLPLAALKRELNNRYELHRLPLDRPTNVPCLSGCFLVARTRLLDRLQGFDERYFMYMEDVDLVRRLGEFGRIVFDPRVVVVHAYAKGSYHDWRLTRYHVASACRYFSKWGWLGDRTRQLRNRAMEVELARSQVDFPLSQPNAWPNAQPKAQPLHSSNEATASHDSESLAFSD